MSEAMIVSHGALGGILLAAFIIAGAAGAAQHDNERARQKTLERVATIAIGQ
ncbi:MAG: hypothetical protein AAF141_00645 [Pseudomonadota bacterium]